MKKNHNDLDLENNVPEQGLFLTPFQRKLLVKNLQADLCPEHQHRIEIMMLADRGCSQAQIRKTLGCSQETVRYWVAIARSGQAHCWKEFTVGRPKSVNEEYCQRLQELVRHNPRDYGYAFQRWTAMWLSKHLAKELDIKISDRHINRLLKSMGLSTRDRPNSSELTNDLAATPARVTIRDLPESSAPLQSDLESDPLPANSSPLVDENPNLHQMWAPKWAQSSRLNWGHLNSGSTKMMLQGL
jgi:transposase